MDKRYVDLINTLLPLSTEISSNDLSILLDISSRTVKKYIKDINEQNNNLILSSSKGYIIGDKEKAVNLISNEDELIPQTQVDRQYYILNQLFHNDFYNIYDLADEMYVSTSLVKLDIQNLKKITVKYHIQITQKNDNLYLVGYEKDKRKLLTDLIYKETDNNFLNIQYLKDSFPQININKIIDTLKNSFEQFNYYVDDYALINIALHFAITIDRIQNKNIIKSQENNYSFSNFIIHVCSSIEKKFNMQIPASEKHELDLIVKSRINVIDIDSVTINNIKEYVSKDTIELVQMMLKIMNAYQIVLDDDNFYIRFSIHINNLLERSKYNHYSRNPLNDNIKNSCPLIYEIAIEFANLINKYAGVRLIEDEIGYLAMHIGSAIHNHKTNQNKLKCVLCSHAYQGVTNRIVNELKKNFIDDLIITSIVNDQDRLFDLDCDMIISVQELSHKILTPHVIISPFVSDNDIKQISKLAITCKLQKQRKEFENNLKLLTDESLFFRDINFNDKDEVLEFLSNELIKKNYVSNNFYNEIIERENLATTAYFNFAIPHTLKLNANKTALAILIPKTSITWDDKKIDLVIMMCFSKEDRVTFNNTFEPLTQIMSNNITVNELIKSTKYDEFVNILVQNSFKD